MNEIDHPIPAATRTIGIRTIVLAVLMLLGAALRVRASLENHSLSIDEAALARNVIERPWNRLIDPLDYAQVAPLGFLVAEKGFLTLFGTNEYSLRALPLASGLASLWLCWLVSRRVLSWPFAACVLALCAVNPSLIEYSATAKQYSLDVAVALLIALVAIEALERPTTRARAWWLGAAGAMTALFSFTSVFGLVASAGAGLLIALQHRGRSATTPWVIAAVIWLAGAGIAAIMSWIAVAALDAEYLRFWWKAGFMPIPPSLGDVSWMARSLENLFSQTGHYRATVGWIGLMLLGIGSLYWRRRPELLVVLAAPLGLTAAASAARLYPFVPGRLQLFLLPSALILVAEGAAAGGRLLFPRPLRTIPIAIVIALGAYGNVSSIKTLTPREEIKPFLRHVKANWQPGDRLWVYYPLGQAFLYYAPRFGFTVEHYALATCSAGSARRYLHEIDALRGSSRLWVLMPHNRVDEVELIRRYLRAIGTMDLGDATNVDAGIGGYRIGYVLQLNAPSAEEPRADRFPIPPDLDRADPYPWMCHGVMQPLARMPRR